MRSVLAGFIATLLWFGAACGGAGNEPSSPPVDVTGTITFTTVEGGTWLIRDDIGGLLYRPLNLPDTYRAEGTRVHARIVERRDIASPFPGMPCDILSIGPAP